MNRAAWAFGLCLLSSGFAARATAGPTELISVRPADNLAAGTSFVGENSTSALSLTGRFVVFNSEASDLVAADTNGARDVFVHDRQTGITERVSVNSSGVEADNGSATPGISADGRFVVFESRARNLVPNDTNDVSGIFYDIFVRDRLAGTTTRVSVSSSGAQGTGPNNVGGAAYPSMSADGRFVAFCASFTNLVPDDTNNATDIFVHDRQTGTTSRVSLASNGAQANGESCTSKTAVSATGRFVAFQSDATNLVPGDTNRAADIFVRDRQTGKTERVSTATSGTQANDRSSAPAISGDGRYVAFWSQASNLVPGDTNGVVDVFVHDRQTGITQRVSVDSHERQANRFSNQPSISADGRYVAFWSRATNLVAGDSNGAADIFVRDLQAGTTTRANLTTSGAQARGGASNQPSISPDGHIIAFTSRAQNLASNDLNDSPDVYVHAR